MILTLTLGVAKETLTHRQEMAMEASMKRERNQLHEGLKLLSIGQAHTLELARRLTTTLDPVVSGDTDQSGQAVDSSPLSGPPPAPPALCVKQLNKYADQIMPEEEHATSESKSP